jgi:hypothetical protein
MKIDRKELEETTDNGSKPPGRGPKKISRRAFLGASAAAAAGGALVIGFRLRERRHTSEAG